MLKELVKALLQFHEQDTYHNHRFVNNLKREIKENVIAAFELSEPLVRQHFKQFKDSPSFVGFLFDLCDVRLPSPPPPHNIEDSRLKECEEELDRMRRVYERSRGTATQHPPESIPQDGVKYQKLQKMYEDLRKSNEDLKKQAVERDHKPCVHSTILNLLKLLKSPHTSSSVEENVQYLETAVHNMLATCESEVQKAQTKNEDCRKQLDNLSNQLNDMFQSTFDYKGNVSVANLQTVIDEIKTKLLTTKNSLEESERSINNQQSIIKDQGQQIEHLSTNLDKCQEDLEEMETHSECSRRNLDAKDGIIEDLEHKNKILNQTLTATQQNVTRLKENLRSVARVLDDLLTIPDIDKTLLNEVSLKFAIERAMKKHKQEVVRRETERCEIRVNHLTQKLNENQEELDDLKLLRAPLEDQTSLKDMINARDHEKQLRLTAEEKLKKVNEIIVNALDEFFKFEGHYDANEEQNAVSLKSQIVRRAEELKSLRTKEAAQQAEMEGMRDRCNRLSQTLQDMKVECFHVDSAGQEDDTEILLETLKTNRRKIQDILNFIHSERGDVSDVSKNVEINLAEIHEYVKEAEKDRQDTLRLIEEYATTMGSTSAAHSASTSSTSKSLANLKDVLEARFALLLNELKQCRLEIERVRGLFGAVYKVVMGKSEPRLSDEDVQEILRRFHTLESEKIQAEADLKKVEDERLRVHTEMVEVQRTLVETIEALNFKEIKLKTGALDSAQNLKALVDELNTEMKACRTAANITQTTFLRDDLERVREVLYQCREPQQRPETPQTVEELDRTLHKKALLEPYVKKEFKAKVKKEFKTKVKRELKETYFVQDSVIKYQECIQRLKYLFSCLYQYHFQTMYWNGLHDSQMQNLQVRTSELDVLARLLTELKDKNIDDLNAMNDVVYQFFTELIEHIQPSSDSSDPLSGTEIHEYLQKVAAKTETVIQQLHQDIHAQPPIAWQLKRSVSKESLVDEEEEVAIEEIGPKKRKTIIGKVRPDDEDDDDGEMKDETDS